MGYHKPSSPCKHNILVVFHGIVGPNKSPHQGWGLTTIQFVMMTYSQLCRYCPFWAQRALTSVKRVFKVKRSSYIYSAMNFFLFDMGYQKNKEIKLNTVVVHANDFAKASMVSISNFHCLHKWSRSSSSSAPHSSFSGWLATQWDRWVREKDPLFLVTGE